MFAVIFEVQPRPEKVADYLRLAGALRPELEKIDGFVAIERFAGRDDRSRVLSLSIWRDEKALIRWRTQAAHHTAQQTGRAAIFADYHLRVGEVVADSDVDRLPQQRFDETETGAATCVTVTELAPVADAAAVLGWPAADACGMVAAEWFESLYTPGKRLLLVGWRDAAAADRQQPQFPGGHWRHRRVRIIRDYGMFDRAEAPQYYPPIAARFL